MKFQYRQGFRFSTSHRWEVERLRHPTFEQFEPFPNPGLVRRCEYKPEDGSSGGANFHSRPEHGKWQAGMNHHRDPYSNHDSIDPAEWDCASYTPDFLAELELLPDAPNDYRQAALYHLRLMFAVDEFVTAAPDARFAVIVVAVTLGWPSTRGLSVGNIADQLGCSPSTITRACARFREMSGLAGGGVRFIGNGAGSNGDKPAATVRTPL